MKRTIDAETIMEGTCRKEAPQSSTTDSNSVTCGLSEESLTGIPHEIPHKLTRRPGSMTRKRKRRSSIVKIGNGPARVRIYMIKRKDGYDQFTLAWKEGGMQRTRCFSSMEDVFRFPPNIRLEPDHALGMLMRLAADGEWRNPPPGSTQYQRFAEVSATCGNCFRRLSAFLETRSRSCAERSSHAVKSPCIQNLRQA